MIRHLALLSALLTSACCGGLRDRVVLLPGPDGKLGKIAVLQKDGETVLSTAYASATVNSSGKLASAPADAATLARFDDLRAALPKRPSSYVLYFEGDSDQLTADSREQALTILPEIAARPAAEVVIIGHTDRMGATDYNDQLSLARASAVRDQLTGLHFEPKQMRVEGRGERELAVYTADETPEPRNRRAEISVR